MIILKRKLEQDWRIKSIIMIYISGIFYIQRHVILIYYSTSILYQAVIAQIDEKSQYCISKIRLLK